jgi:hypothetical protein
MTQFFSPQRVSQREVEEIAYSFSTADFGSSPTDVSFRIYKSINDSLTDVSSTCLGGPGSVAGAVITTPLVRNISPDTTYILEITFTIGGNTWSPILHIRGV